MINDDPSTDDCRVMQFQLPVTDRIFVGHVIKSLLVKSEIGCEANCFDYNDCMSVNLGPQEDGTYLCELSSSDHTLHPDDLLQHNKFIYKPVWVSNI